MAFLPAMKALASTILLLALQSTAVKIDAGASKEDPGPESPMVKVIAFLEKLKEELQESGEAENQQWATFSTWCNGTITKTKADIAANEALIESSNTEIERLSGALGAVLAQIAHAEKEIAENLASQKQATTIRVDEKKDFDAVEKDLTGTITSLKGATERLGGGSSNNGGDTSSASFLAKGSRPSHAADGLRQILEKPALLRKVSEDKLQLLQDFVKASGPASDYNTQTTEVTGIIGQMTTDFEADLASATAEEKDKVTAYESLMKTLEESLDTAQKTLARLKADNAADLKDLSNHKTVRSDTQAELASNEKLLDNTELQCKIKGEEMEVRKKRRTKELAGMDQALEILQSEDATKTFDSSAAVGTSFLQISESSDLQAKRQSAYNALKEVASKYKSRILGEIAVQVKRSKPADGGPFRKVIDRIDGQVSSLREQEREDVKHRDDCQNDQAKNKREKATLDHTIQKATTKIERLGDKITQLQNAINLLEVEMNETKEEIKNRSDVRTEEHEEYLTALKHDQDALALLQNATASVAKFYNDHSGDHYAMKRFGDDVSLLASGAQKASNTSADEPEAAKAATPQPKIFKDEDYKGSKATGGLLELMSIVTDDLKKEISDEQAQDQEDQLAYEKDHKTMDDIYHEKEAKKISLEKQLAEKDASKVDQEDIKSVAQEEASTNLEQKETLASDCEWVTTKYEQRREKRRAEVDALLEAKGILGTIQ
eukprot:TRINITY_DN60806_c0_g1_i1.p1 TRINITY_DN60806_c0_g1~~TRINITY_DN60806_c0_g1_i1.p1  ORF type:complete len:741 (-),score=204.11 TRINITY_DN60806_c0_g1_i1:24-2189(-)